MTGGRWVFGYGSLVSPASFGSTIGRELRPGRDFFPAELVGFGRRWNYGVIHTAGVTVAVDGSVRSWTIVALGVVPAGAEAVNGVVGWVSDDELARLDHRERHYDRVDVTDAVAVDGSAPGSIVTGSIVTGSIVTGSIVTYVPSPEAVGHGEAAGRAGRAAIERRYWDLVDAAFTALGDDQRARFHSTTPDPGFPILDLVRRPVG